ncbi:MAG TPA: molybdopterin-dependent oxidoreductase [Sphingobium sp.]
MTISMTPGEDGRHATFCRLCESFCGMIATVKDGRIVALAPDRDNPHSQGHVCVKGVSVHQVTHDPDRVTVPLKRVGGPGEFAPVGWDEALDDIAARLKALLADHGAGALASYLGNPTAFSTNAYIGFMEFMSALGSYKLYGAGSQDSNARMVANYMIHGGPGMIVFPDLINTDFLLILGANPLVSNGWMIFDPRWRHDLDAIAQRGRVVVIDPRASETAQRFEHHAIKADGDVWLLTGLIRTIIEEGLVDPAVIARDTEGYCDLAVAMAMVGWDEIGERTGMDADVIRGLARDFAASPRAAVYGGLGLCRGRFGTFGGYLSSVLNAITGRYGQEGGVRFGRPPWALPPRPPVAGHGERRTRIGNLPTIAGKMPCAMLPADIEEEGDDRVRALILSAGNPVVSAPGGARLARALHRLDLFVSLDFYHNETNAHADYILPTTTFLERADWPYVGMFNLMRPFLQYSEAVIPPVGEAREDYAIYDAIARRMGLDGPSAQPLKKRAARMGRLPDPNAMVDRMVRKGPVGDAFGRTDGWSRARLRDHPHGVMVEDMPDDRQDWRERIAYLDGRLRIWHPLATEEMARVHGEPSPQADTLRLIGRRDIRSINSWMHNVDKLVRSQEQTLMIHPDDAAARGIGDGASVRIANENGAITVPAEVTGDIARGMVSYPHGWGHKAGWERANRTEGVNVNILLGLGRDWVEPVSGMTLIDCLDVQVTLSGNM